jgi:hypothetical protein
MALLGKPAGAQSMIHDYWMPYEKDRNSNP